MIFNQLKYSQLIFKKNIQKYFEKYRKFTFVEQEFYFLERREYRGITRICRLWINLFIVYLFSG